MSYLTLSEASSYVNHKTGMQIEPAALLRAGVHGVLLLCAPFGFGLMYNATLHKNEDFRADLLVIPPSHLLEIETEGRAKIQAAHSLDGEMIYFPLQVRTRDQLRVLVRDLDKFIPLLVTDTPEPQAAPVVPAGASVVIHSTKARRDTLTPVIELAQTKCRNPIDAAEVWAALQVLAENKTAPLLGGTEDGLQYLKGGAAEIFTRKSLGKRLTR